MKDTLDAFNLFLNDVRDLEVLSDDETMELIRKAQNKDKEARDKLIVHNIKLVYKWAFKYGKNKSNLLDLIQEGTLGLFDAIRKFDFEKNVKFSTYASLWITNYIRKYLDKKSKIVSFDAHTLEEVSKYKKEFERLTNSLERYPSIDELSDALNFPYEKTVSIYNIIKETKSIDEKISKESDLSFKDVIESDFDTFEVVSNSFLKRDLNEAIKNAHLSEKELFILEHRSGINNKEKLTLDQLSKKYGVSRERIRQIEAYVMRRIKKQVINLEDYVNEKALLQKDEIEKENLRPHQSIVKTLNCTHEELNNALKELTKDELELFHKIILTSSTNREKEYFNYYVIPKIKEIIIEHRFEQENITLSISKYDMNFLSKYINERELKITLMMLGIYDDNSYNENDIANLYNITSDEVIDIYQKTVKLLKKYNYLTNDKKKIKKR